MLVRGRSRQPRTDRHREHVEYRCGLRMINRFSANFRQHVAINSRLSRRNCGAANRHEQTQQMAFHRDVILSSANRPRWRGSLTAREMEYVDGNEVLIVYNL